MANELMQGLLQSLLQTPEQQQQAEGARNVELLSQPNPLAATLGYLMPQRTAAMERGVRGLLGLQQAQSPEQLITDNPELMKTSAGMAKLAQMAQARGDRSTALRFTLMSQQKQVEERQEQQAATREEAELARIEAQTEQAQVAARIAESAETRAIADEQWNKEYKEGSLAIQNAQVQGAQDARNLAREQLAATIAQRDFANSQLRASEAAEFNRLDSEISQQLNLANKAVSVAERYAALKPIAGFAGRSWEAIKGAFGTEDDITRLKNDFEGMQAQFALMNLPKGPASDKDIQFAMQGFPNSSFNAEQVESFMRGQAKMATLLAAQKQMQLEYLTRNYENNTMRGTTSGWRNEWNKISRDQTALDEFIADSFGEAYLGGEQLQYTPVGEIDFSTLNNPAASTRRVRVGSPRSFR